LIDMDQRCSPVVRCCCCYLCGSWVVLLHRSCGRQIIPCAYSLSGQLYGPQTVCVQTYRRYDSTNCLSG
jgi:hypothetical protein